MESSLSLSNYRVLRRAHFLLSCSLHSQPFWPPFAFLRFSFWDRLLFSLFNFTPKVLPLTVLLPLFLSCLAEVFLTSSLILFVSWFVLTCALIACQKVRLALEERGVDYTSHHVNPITGKNLDAIFFQMNPSGRLPVFQNGSHILYEAIDIILYIERIAKVSSGGEGISVSGREVVEWMRKIQEWDPKFFTLSHIPDKYRVYGSKFIRRVVIARMSDSPELAGAYHRKLREAYQTEEKLKDPDVLRRSKEHLVMLLDEVERQLSVTPYLAGQDFTMADVMLIPVLARLVLLDLEHEYIADKPNTAEYWLLVQQRPSYKRVIGKYFDGWRKHKTLLKTWCCVRIRSLLKKY